MGDIKIGNSSITLKLGSANVSAAYLGATQVYGGGTPPTPTSCYEVTQQPISSYTSTTYDSVFSYDDLKWYMKNNLDQYEEYGIYDIVDNISSATTYEGKLAVVGSTEYQYSGNSWVVVGTYEYSSTTLTIEGRVTSYDYQGMEIPTTFKIPISDTSGIFEPNIKTQEGDYATLEIRTDSYKYIKMGEEWYEEQGTVTDDGTYYYYSLPNTQSVVIDRVENWAENTFHIIINTIQASVQYVEKNIPTAKEYVSVASMESDGCPNVGIGQYGVVSNNVYQFDNNEDWNSVSANSIKFIGKYSGGTANVVECNLSYDLTPSETLPSYISTPLTSATIGSCVTSLEWSTFRDCTGLTTIDIPDNVTTIKDSAFWGCSDLTSCNLGSGVTTIETNAFYQCGRLRSIDIPSGVTSIGNSTFSQCSSLSSVTLPNSVTTIGTNAFYYCSSLTNINIPNSVTSIGGSVFSNCSSLTNITIPSGVTSIASTTFTNCFSLTSCTIGSGVTSIGNGAFQNCRTLTSLHIPSGVTSICANTFSNCYSLTSITVDSSNTKYDSRNNCNALINTSTNELMQGSNNTIIPNGVTKINNAALQNCSGLTSIDIPDSVTSIGTNAFRSCNGATGCTIGTGITSINIYAFYNCTNLTSITINATTPPRLSDANAFTNTNNCPIYVPSASVNTYKTTNKWSSLASRIQAIP